MYIFLGGTFGHSMDSMLKAKYIFSPESKEADGVVCTLFIRTNRIKEYDQHTDRYPLHCSKDPPPVKQVIIC